MLERPIDSGNGKSTDIGTIDIPHMLKNRDGNWGWWYIARLLPRSSTHACPFDPLALPPLRRLANEQWTALMQTTSKYAPWNEAKTWLQSRAAGQQPQIPKSRLPAARR